jgi:DNA-directed RNA polymerase specialized sigma24 family protein
MAEAGSVTAWIDGAKLGDDNAIERLWTRYFRRLAGLSEFFSREPTPQDAAQFSDQYDQLLRRLKDPALKTIAVRKLQGYTNVEIARELSITSRTVDRKLRLIRAVWSEEVGL